ncbi:hypothetical protein BC830DRAFT_1170119 [Chytriomyces sp. MP71]|nr:hypothetical protein BC830DRAFT_1170119 [Chytriomyces sp. MP71]
MHNETAACFELLRALYEPMGEFVLEHPSVELPSPLDSEALTSLDATGIQVSITVRSASDSGTELCVRVRITLPMQACDPDASGKLSVDVAYEAWLSRAQHAELQAVAQAALGEHAARDASEAAMAVLDAVRDALSSCHSTSTHPGPTLDARIPAMETNTSEPQNDLKRYWFLLISLSTREKRNDLVAWAPSFRLTGFVLAGKPALVVCEGLPKDIDAYMADIKTLSWADVPSHQKKITLVCTETIAKRKFEDMAEVTDLFEMRGARGNRPDLAQVKHWFEDRGVGKMFPIVFQGDGQFGKRCAVAIHRVGAICANIEDFMTSTDSKWLKKAEEGQTSSLPKRRSKPEKRRPRASSINSHCLGPMARAMEKTAASKRTSAAGASCHKRQLEPTVTYRYYGYNDASNWQGLGLDYAQEARNHSESGFNIGGSGRENLRGKSTADVSEMHLNPMTLSTQASLIATYSLSDHNHPRKLPQDATWFISHAWGRPFLETFDALTDFFHEQGLKDPVVWFDLFSNSQHGTASKPFKWWQTVFLEAVKSIGSVL